MRKSLRFFLTCLVFITVVDYTTAFNPDWQRWVAHMPEIWLFYIGYPLLFTMLIYKAGWRSWRLALAVLVSALMFEILVFDNPLLVSFPLNLLMLPLAYAIYAFITFIPFWLVEGNLRRHSRLTIILTVIWLLVSILVYISVLNG